MDWEKQLNSELKRGIELGKKEGFVEGQKKGAKEELEKIHGLKTEYRIRAYVSKRLKELSE